MAVSARIAHHVPGRMRIHVRGGRQNHHALRRLKHLLSEMDAVTRVEANPDTGSVVIHYRHESPKRFEHELKSHGASSGAFDLHVAPGAEVWQEIQEEAEFLAVHSELARAVVEETKRLDARVKLATHNQLDLKVLVPLGLAIGSFFFVGLEVATPLWITLGIFSFNSFVALHPPLPFPKTENQMIPRKEENV